MFRPNPRLAAELKQDPGVRDELRQQANAAAGIVRSLTPHAPESYTVSADGESVTLGTSDSVGHLVEWGSVNNPPYAPLRRGVRAAGLRLEETGP